MVVDTIKENLCVNKLVATKKEVILVEGDMIVPDSKPDILNTICTSGVVCIYKKEVLEEKVRIDGNINTYIMYMADYVVEMNIPDQQIEKLEEISEQMKQEELPKTREEFEGRALLYHILMDLEEFLVYKKRFVNGLDEKKLRIYWKQEMEQKDSANELQK